MYMKIEESNYTLHTSTKDAWEAMHEAIAKAKKSVYWEVYIFSEDEVGNRFFDLLEKQAKKGLDVKLVIDSLGGFGLSSKRLKSLKAAGVDFHFFHERKKRYRGVWKKLVSRTHRKILIIDENLGFIGGVNVDKKHEDWLDIHVSIKGKAVRSLLRAFAKNYIICGGQKAKVKHLLKYKFRVEKDIENIEFIYDDAHSDRSRTRKRYVEALTKARERVILFSPYYFPDKKFLYALWNARKRGVRVDLLIPFRSDVRMVQYAAYAWFAVMKRYGVNIHVTDKMMHGKGVVVDNDWAMVGSTNLDKTSFYDNYEANVRIRDKRFVRRLKMTLLKWAEKAQKIEESEWKKRSLFHRIQEWFALQTLKIWHRNNKNK